MRTNLLIMSWIVVIVSAIYWFFNHRTLNIAILALFIIGLIGMIWAFFLDDTTEVANADERARSGK